ncbi:rhomboid family intramembrane serine protease [Staphylococcus chromogenes]|nr:rhomboid family intramembrane serine protease [Staphylococcus chromogenes]
MPRTEPWRRLYASAPATSVLCLGMLFVYVVTAAQSLSLADNLYGSSLADAWVLSLPEMRESWFGPLRALTAAFLHIGPVHLAFNVLLLFLFGREVEQTYSSRVLLWVFVTSAVGASAFSVLVAPASQSAGASGAGYALMVLLVLISFQRGADLRAPIVLILANLVFSVIDPGVALWGHVGGLIFGSLLSLPLASRRPAVQRGGLIIVFLGAIGLLLWVVLGVH